MVKQTFVARSRSVDLDAQPLPRTAFPTTITVKRPDNAFLERRAPNRSVSRIPTEYCRHAPKLPF
ncbi:hypothetical protein LX32DRAFT_644874 [Colletotrichum zoysiae]|uniref:Uncharacterized protein n=1 Tax=Colletotrichum zoysiae TaxID=1216348 RepID=A0AAD9H6H3_9PEZI|nr:hypothetical protein LX32DRAFT_644874 [Colletotrichum zoysiae]